MWRLKQASKAVVQYNKSILAERKIRKTRRRWLNLEKQLPRSDDGRVLLHIGCGDINVPGFVNLDARPRSHIHIVTDDLFRLEMIPDDVIDLVYMSHVLEHVSHREVGATLREMYRILKNRGVLRISVPDFDKIVHIYQATGRNVAAIEQPLMGGQDYSFNYHYSVFNEQHLRNAMLDSGYRETRAWDPNSCEYHDFDDWASRNISWGNREFPISLNIEAIK